MNRVVSPILKRSFFIDKRHWMIVVLHRNGELSSVLDRWGPVLVARKTWVRNKVDLMGGALAEVEIHAFSRLRVSAHAVLQGTVRSKSPRRGAIPWVPHMLTPPTQYDPLL